VNTGALGATPKYAGINFSFACPSNCLPKSAT